MSKICNICKQNKPLTEYRKFGVGNYRGSCNPCDVNERRKEKIKISIEEGLFKKADDPVKGMIICIQCGKNKQPKEFREARFECVDCERKCGRKYRKSDVGKNKARAWVRNNKIKMAKLQADWYNENRKEIREKENLRLHNDELFSMKTNLRIKLVGVINSSLKNKHVDFLNCTDTFFKEWLIQNFDDRMKFANHGSYWHVDHVIPIATFNNLLNDDNQKRLCFSWFNISPTKKEYNLSKHHHINNMEAKLQIITHLHNLLDFCLSKCGVNIDGYIELCATHLGAGKP